ncbi:proline-rich protein HaeIII subfamily 1-like [Lepus europaeus]|uniref:proline-rich protein HaeIII subfamily 1-like n=1 Tax=Lepus europaeus TaxID=9983 RepID=UPI002B4A593F|nr:proline-rich protein HaeIII subfamily 1-like [Lepus europaeus]
MTEGPRAEGSRGRDVDHGEPRPPSAASLFLHSRLCTGGGAARPQTLHDPKRSRFPDEKGNHQAAQPESRPQTMRAGRQPPPRLRTRRPPARPPHLPGPRLSGCPPPPPPPPPPPRPGARAAGRGAGRPPSAPRQRSSRRPAAAPSGGKRLRSNRFQLLQTKLPGHPAGRGRRPAGRGLTSRPAVPSANRRSRARGGPARSWKGPATAADVAGHPRVPPRQPSPPTRGAAGWRRRQKPCGLRLEMRPVVPPQSS